MINIFLVLFQRGNNACEINFDCTSTYLKEKIVPNRMLYHYTPNIRWKKVTITQKPCPDSLKSFSPQHIFKLSSGRKKQSMKAESTAFAEQRETTCHEEKESRHRWNTIVWSDTKCNTVGCTVWALILEMVPNIVIWFGPALIITLSLGPVPNMILCSEVNYHL